MWVSGVFIMGREQTVMELKGGKTWIMDGYYWELKGETSALPKLTGGRQLIEFTPFFFHFSSPLGPRMLSESSVTHSSLLTVIFPTSAAKPSFYRTYELCIEGLIYVQLMLWFQPSYVTAGTEPWFINPGLCVFPMHECKRGGCKNSRLLPSTLRARHTHQMTQTTTTSRKNECPHIMRPGSLFDLLPGNTHSKLFPKGWKPCCCAYGHLLCQ